MSEVFSFASVIGSVNLNLIYPSRLLADILTAIKTLGELKIVKIPLDISNLLPHEKPFQKARLSLLRCC